MPISNEDGSLDEAGNLNNVQKNNHPIEGKVIDRKKYYRTNRKYRDETSKNYSELQEMIAYTKKYIEGEHEQDTQIDMENC